MKQLKLFLSILFTGLLTYAGAQTPQEVSISDGGTFNSDNCQEYFILTDSNADDGNYEENEDFQITLCFNDIEMSDAQVQILPTNPETGDVWDVDENSSLFIYEGPDDTGTLLGEFNSVSDPNGVFFTTDVSCLTFVFISGEGSSGEGFRALFQCEQPLQPFNLSVEVEPPNEYSDFEVDGIADDANIITICYGDTIDLTAILDFPLSDATGNGYEQSIENTLITWNWGDNTFDQGLGLTEVSHWYEPEGGFYIYVTAEDQNGRREFFDIYVLVSPRPNFTGILFNDTLCAGDTTLITGGILGLDTVGVEPTSGLVNINFEYNDSLALPDGNGTLYSTTIDIAGYEGSPTLEELGDLVSICINVEHSYLGDLEAWITCPNGQTALLFDGYTGVGQYPDGQTGFGGGFTFLGDATDGDNLDPIQGVGFDYCFSNTVADLGTMEEEFNAGNTTPVTDGDAMVPGTYIPAESFEALEGCPVNGPWTLSFADNIGLDNGYVFGWGIEFSDLFPIDSIFYSPDIVDAYWVENDDIVANNDTIITIVPSNPGNNSFTFIVEDSFGCLHDTTFTPYVRPFVNISDAIACDLTHTLTPQNAPNGGDWEILEQPTENSVLTFDFINGAAADITANEYGIYILQITENNCGYQDVAQIDFRPDPIIQPFVPDTTLCVGAEITFDPGPQLPNSGNFNYNWTQNGTTFSDESGAVTVDETGQYILVISGACGSATDTSDVVAITIEFEGDTLCGLQTGASVEVQPEGSGFWTADPPNISFSNANLTSTSISAGDYGEYSIFYTDNRCINDSVSRNFIFVNPPEVNILPEDPEFCLEKDTLILSTDGQGDIGNVFLWSVNGELQQTQDSILIFPPPSSFEPLEPYQITVLVQDIYGVCPFAESILNFEGQWCTYNIPNVITPNGDRQNDRFNIQFLEFFPVAQLRIYDRWGKEVFSSDDYAQYQRDTDLGATEVPDGGWDPGDNPEGTYFYELILPSVDRVESGYVQVLRGDS